MSEQKARKPKINQKRLDEFKIRVAAMSNDELLLETINASGGDNYDGCFTEQGDAEFEILENELIRRLKAIGFLKK